MNERREQSPGELPKARVRKNWRSYLFWLVPVAAAALAGFFIYQEVIEKGPTLHIYFDDAIGIQKGQSKVMYRGAEIGKIEGIELTPDNKRVKLTASLDKSAENVARQGSLFWIVKPEIGLNQITGLQTIVGGNYLTVQPGPGKHQTEFYGLPEPPPTQKSKPGLRVILLAEKLGSIKEHSPVLYHGMEVGEVHGSELGETAQTVRIYLNVEEKYAPLVRMNSKFWNAGGANVSLGLSGLQMSAQSVRTLITGGIAFATPDTKAPQADEGTAFRLYERPQNEWQRWFPAIKLPLIDRR